MTRTSFLLLTLSTLLWVKPLPAQEPPAGRIVVGPNIRVSTDGQFPHLEPTIAASPTNPRTLIAAAAVLRDNNDGVAVYKSVDGGLAWKASDLPMRIGGDVQVMFSTEGAGVVVALGA